jgi:carboxymethylenebutenolidase
MPHREVSIDTEDGRSSASLQVPEGEGPWPAVIMFTDAGGLRDAFREMGRTMAGLGYVTLVPDIYYRHGEYAPFDMQTVFADAQERERILAMVHSVSTAGAVSDARAYVDFLLSLPECSGSAVATTGYCLGGTMSLNVAGRLGDLVAAAASFHGGDLASEDDPDSPHLSASGIAAEIYVAGATKDRSFSDDQRDRLDEALRTAGVSYAIETYPARHGFAVPDSPVYDEAASQRHWSALDELFGRAMSS